MFCWAMAKGALQQRIAPNRILNNIGHSLLVKRWESFAKLLIHVSEHKTQKVARSFTREGLASVAQFLQDYGIRQDSHDYPVHHDNHVILSKLTFTSKNLEVFDQVANRVFG